jgi:hypothetical protein
VRSPINNRLHDGPSSSSISIDFLLAVNIIKRGFDDKESLVGVASVQDCDTYQRWPPGIAELSPHPDLGKAG